MLRSTFLLLMWLSFLGLGAAVPFVAGLGYVWIDLFSPHRVAYSLLPGMPVAMITALVMMGAYVAFDRAAPPRPTALMVLIVLFAIWITLTTTWAVVPDSAWRKWDWAVKAVGVAAFLPFLFRSRIQIDALLVTMILSVAATMLPYGIKTLISGGGYGTNLGLFGGNYGLAESSTLAMAASASIPLILYLRNHSRVLPRGRLTTVACYGLVVAALLTVIGTTARTGLVALAVLAVVMWWRSHHKTVYVLAALVLAAIGWAVADQTYIDRMMTIFDYGSESSALGRIAVWLWTLEYVGANPLGGGFDVYRVNTFSVPIEGAPGEFLTVQGKAFHSIYFEVLGEHGIPGLALYLGIVATMFLNLRRVMRDTRGERGLLWAHELARSLIVTLVVYLAGGAFVGIAFQPMLYYFAALTISLHQFVRRAKAADPAPAPAADETAAAPAERRRPPSIWGETGRTPQPR